MTDNDQNTALLEPWQPPKITELIEMLRTAVSMNSHAINRMSTAKEVRDCTTALTIGRDGTGTKGLDAKGRPRGPWEGSSDAQVKLADDIITELKLMLMLAVSRSQVGARPQEMDDTGAAALATGLLEYYFTGSQMDEEVWSTVGLAFDCTLAYGLSVVKVGWKETFGQVEKELDYNTLLDWAEQQGKQEYAAELAALVGDAQLTEGEVQQLAGEIEAAGQNAAAATTAIIATRAARPQLVALLEAFDPSMVEGEAPRLAAALQRATQASVRYYAYERTESRPCWRFLQPWVDVFFLGLSRKLQDEPFIGESEWVTRTQLEEMAAAEGWDEEWLRKVREAPGRSFTFENMEADWWLNGADVGQSIPLDVRDQHYYQLTRITYKAANKAGVIGVWETLVHDACPDMAAYHRLCEGADGAYPYIEIPRNTCRRLIDNIGIAEEVEDIQHQLKAMVDARHDKTALDVKPPVKVHWKDVKRGLRAHIYPGAEFPEREGVSTSFMQVGNMGAQTLSLNDEGQLRIQVARRFGLIHPDVPAPITQAHLEGLVTHVFKYLKILVSKTFSLLQQHMDPLTGIRVSGGPEIFAANGGDKVLNVSREDIQGRFDFHLYFDPRDLNMEWVMERVKALTELVIPIDSMASIDRAAIVRMAVASIAPRLAATVKTAEKASEDEVADELAAWTAIVSGAEPPMREGVNFAARYGFWQNLINTSPRAKSLLQGDQQVLAVSQNRLKYLKQGITQEKNKLVGRVGTSEVLGEEEPSLLGE